MTGHRERYGLLTAIKLRNWRSIRDCVVRPRSLTLILGPNGSGKGHLLDAPVFVADALREGGASAAARRGGFKAATYRGGKSAEGFSIGLNLKTADWRASYAISYARAGERSWKIDREQCVVENAAGEDRDWFDNRGIHEDAGGQAAGALRMGAQGTVPALVRWGHVGRFRHVVDALTGIRKTEPWPHAMRQPGTIYEPEPTEWNGRTAARELAAMDAAGRDRINAFLSSAWTDKVQADTRESGTMRWLTLKEKAARGAAETQRSGEEMGNGALRLLGLLLILLPVRKQETGRVVLLEEPETGLDAGAVRVLSQALNTAGACGTQVLASTYSRELLRHTAPGTQSLVFGERTGDGSRLGRAARAAVEERTNRAPDTGGGPAELLAEPLLGPEDTGEETPDRELFVDLRTLKKREKAERGEASAARQTLQ